MKGFINQIASQMMTILYPALKGKNTVISARGLYLKSHSTMEAPGNSDYACKMNDPTAELMGCVQHKLRIGRNDVIGRVEVPLDKATAIRGVTRRYLLRKKASEKKYPGEGKLRHQNDPDNLRIASGISDVSATSTSSKVSKGGTISRLFGKKKQKQSTMEPKLIQTEPLLENRSKEDEEREPAGKSAKDKPEFLSSKQEIDKWLKLEMDVWSHYQKNTKYTKVAYGFPENWTQTSQLSSSKGVLLNQSFESNTIYLYSDGAFCEEVGPRGEFKAALGNFFGKCHPLNFGFPIDFEVANAFATETLAANMGLHRLRIWKGYKGQKVVVRTDCLDLIKAVGNLSRGEHEKMPLRNGDRVYELSSADKENLLNLQNVAHLFPQGVVFEWIKGHETDPGNQQADEIAGRARKKEWPKRKANPYKPAVAGPMNTEVNLNNAKATILADVLPASKFKIEYEKDTAMSKLVQKSSDWNSLLPEL
ncbi:unnamed protein product, partial [Mesorhabditis belari]|uniref:RNase H type-1 domain-containing protein n=1 Tax=Mesorhabditis belari TaxID=2138241 RepID=A0AAF3FIS9_9BILA